MPEDPFKNMFGVNRDDPLMLLTALTADISTMNANLKMMSDNTDIRLGNLEKIFERYDDLSRTVIAIQSDMRALIATVAENKARVESIDSIKKDVEANRNAIIPEGKTKIANLEDDLDGLRDDFKDFKNERWKLITGIVLSMAGLLSVVAKDYVWPLILPHLH